MDAHPVWIVGSSESFAVVNAIGCLQVIGCQGYVFCLGHFGRYGYVENVCAVVVGVCRCGIVVCDPLGFFSVSVGVADFLSVRGNVNKSFVREIHKLTKLV